MALRQTMGHLDPRSPRAAEWIEIYGELSVPLVSPSKERRRSAADGMTVREFYRVAVDKLRPDQRERVIGFVMRKYGIARADLERDLDGEHGLPILADDVTVSFDARLVL